MLAVVVVGNSPYSGAVIMQEFRVPLIVRRFLPDGSFEDWTVSELNPANQAANL